MAFDFKTFGTTDKTKLNIPTPSGGFDFNSFGTTTPFGTEKPKELTYVERVGAQYQKAGQDIISGIKTGEEQIQQGNVLGGIRAGLRTVGGVAGATFAPILEAPIIKPLTEKIVGKVLENPEIKSVVTKATELAKQYPNASKDIQNIIDIATLGGGGLAEKPLIQEGKAIAKDISQGVKVALTPSEEVIQNKVISLFNKSVKPTAQKTITQGQKYENDTLNALKTIKSNVNDLNIEDATGELVTGRTPQTLNELAQAVDQTKKLVFNQYDTLAKSAGTAGAIIDAKPIAEEVLRVAQNKALQITNPEVVKYAEQWVERLRSLDVLDTETTQAVIQNLNNNLSAFYKNPTYEAASKVAVDAGVVNNFRQALDKAIEGATGEQYQVLKRQYGALKAIENDVTRAAMRDARKNVKGLLDYTDIFTSGQMLGGILSLNPAMFTRGAVERGFKEYFKFLNDPNRAVQNIFENLDIDTTVKFTPQSATGKFMANPKLGMSIEDVSKDVKIGAKNLASATSQDLIDAGALRRNPNPKGFVKWQYKTENGWYNADEKTAIERAKEFLNGGEGLYKEVSDPLLSEARKYKTAEEFVKAKTIHRGDTSPLKLSEMDTTKVFNPATKESLSAFNNTPGLYFTDSIDNAKSYGKNITSVSTNPNANIIDLNSIPSSRWFNRQRVKSIVESNPRIKDWATNWSENYDEAINNIVNSIMDEKANGNEFLKAIWSDGGFSETDFVNAMKKAGIDGIKVPKEGVNHFVIYNKDALLTKSQLTDIWNKVNKK